MIILLMITFAVIGIIEVPGLVKQKHWRDLAVFSAFFIFAFILALLQSMGIKIPSPIKGIVYLIKDVLHLNYQ